MDSVTARVAIVLAVGLITGVVAMFWIGKKPSVEDEELQSPKLTILEKREKEADRNLEERNKELRKIGYTKANGTRVQ